MVDDVSMGEPNWFCGQNLDSPRIDINYTYTMYKVKYQETIRQGLMTNDQDLRDPLGLPSDPQAS